MTEAVINQAASNDVPRHTRVAVVAGSFAWAVAVVLSVAAFGLLSGALIAVWGISVPVVLVMVLAETPLRWSRTSSERVAPELSVSMA